MMLSWFDASEAKKFGQELARFFLERIPVAAQLGDKAFTLKADKVLFKINGQITRFKQSNKLNTYKKAQLGNAFKWALRDAGVSIDYADKLTNWLMMQLK